MNAVKPFSDACERNREPIVGILQDVFAPVRSVLEIGSGTGQHAVYFAAALPLLVWQTSDLPENHAGIRMWIEDAGLSNVRAPLALNVDDACWPIQRIDAVFTANTLHILSWQSVNSMLRGVSGILPPGGPFCVYGPFNYGGRHTSPSNASFDAMLRSRDPESGIRDFESVCELAAGYGLGFEADHPMPANNRILVFRRQ